MIGYMTCIGVDGDQEERLGMGVCHYSTAVRGAAGSSTYRITDMSGAPQARALVLDKTVAFGAPGQCGM